MVLCDLICKNNSTLNDVYIIDIKCSLQHSHTYLNYKLSRNYAFMYVCMYLLPRVCVYFPTINAFFEIKTLHIIYIEPILNFQMVTPTFNSKFNLVG